MEWTFGPTAYGSDSWMLRGRNRSARYYPMHEPWEGYKIELWGPESHREFGPQQFARANDEKEAREICEKWSKEAD